MGVGRVRNVAIRKRSALVPQLDCEMLRSLAAKYVWWNTPDEALAQPERIVAQVMNIGDYDDVELLVQHAGDDCLRAVLTQSEIGQFSEKSWTYWHYRLGLAEPGRVPAMPQRRIS